MQNIKKYFMTLALLLTAVTGAWAQDPTVNFPSEITVGEEFSFSFDAPDNVETVYLEIENVFEIFSGISSNVGTLKYTYNGNLRGETAVSLYFLINGFQLQVVKGVTIKEPAPAEITEWSLTPDADKKVWTLAKMPGSNVELQVEYYPESNLFLGKEALKDKANISVLNGETAVAFDDDGKSTATVTEGNTVTAKFTGKKVLGMKVEKKGAASKLASEVTPDDIFKVIASDGMIYDNIAAAESAGTVAQGLVVYVGSNTGNATYTHGMALALQDEANNTWSGAKDACNAKNTSTPIVGALWIQASKDQWNTMFNAVGGDSKLRDCFSSAGGTNLIKFGNYWSSSSHEDYGEQGDFYMFSEDDWPGDWGSTSVYYNDNYHVRACIVF